MRYFSVCSGIDGASVAWESLGWECAGLSEIDPFARAVLKYRFPETRLFGDFAKLGRDDIGTVDLVIGGTPCQDFSVAGLRAGLDGKRGQLTIEFVRFLERIRPRWMVWENVPGVLSCDDGRAFGIFLGALGECGYGFAYRVLDAQYAGVPQRRRRVFVVGYFGDWRPAAAVLFERDGLSGNPPPRRKTGEEPAFCVTSRFGSGRNDPTAETYIAQPIAFALRGREDGAQPEVHADGDSVGALRAASGGSSRDIIAFSCKDAGSDSGDVAPTLRAMGHSESHANGGGQIAVAYQCQGTNVGPMGTFRAGNGNTAGGVPFTIDSGVRRLTPRECERLQGFPDDFTLVPYKKKPAKDAPRYKALGNSFAVPVVRWVGERIKMVEEILDARRE